MHESPVIVEMQQEQLQRPSRLATYAANIVIASSLLVGASLYEGDEAQNVSCLTVSAEQIHETESLLEAPDIPAIAAVRKYDQKRGDKQMTKDMANLAATKNGLRLANAYPYTWRFENDSKHGYKLPFENYFAEAKRYFDTFGITLTTENSQSLMNTRSSYVLTEQQRESTVAKQNVIKLVEEASSVPQEYFAYAGLKTIVLDENKSVAASWNGANRALEINVTGKDNATAFKHELAHATAEELCSDSHFNVTFATDGNIRNLNTQAYTYNSDITQIETPTRVSYYFEGKALEKAVNEQLMSKEQATRQLEQDGKRVSFTDAYGATNPAEDSAQIGRYFTRPWAQNHVLNPEMPRLREKALVWLTRMRLKAPKLFAYINDMQPPIGSPK